MPDIQKAVEGLQSGADVLFLLVGAVLVFAMHGGFAFLEAGTVRHKNQVNALCKILVDFAISTVAYFFIGYTIAYGVAFFVSAEALNGAAQGLRSAGPDAGQVLLPRAPSPRRCRPSSRAASPSAPSSARSASATALIVGLFYPLLRGHRLEQELRPAGGLLQRPRWARSSTTSPAPSSCTPLAAGSASRPCASSGLGSGATTRAAPSASRRRRSRGSPWAPGCCASAGSAST